MADWDFEKNNQLGLDSSKIIVSSATRAYWKCHVCGREWESAVCWRAKAKYGCPVCAGKMRGAARIANVIARKGCFANVELLKDWDYNSNKQDPQEFTPNSNKKVSWKCHVCGYQWEAKISNRVHGRGCPACAGKALYVGRNDFATTHPELSREWHPTKNGDLRPCDVMHGQARKVWWLCPNGHAYFASLNKRTSDHTGCPICNSGRQTSFREQSFYYYIKKIFPNAVSRYKPEWLGRMELDIFIPEKKLAIEYDGTAWHKDSNFGREKHKYELCAKHGIKLWRVKEKMPESGMGMADRMFCVQNVENKNEFRNLLILVLTELDPECNMWTRKKFRKFWTEVDVDLDRDRYEINQYRYSVKNSLAEKCPDIAAEWHPTKNRDWTPAGISWKSEHKVWWLCSRCANEYEMTVAHRVTDNGCPICAKERSAETYKKNLIAKRGSLSDPKLLRQWNYEKNQGRTPEMYTRCSGEKVSWRCDKCGYEWQATIANRSHGRGCPCCANRVVVKGVNDLLTLYPDLCKEWDDDKNGSLTPDRVTPGSHARVWWICSKCGYSYVAQPCRRALKGSGCRKCADKANGVMRRKRKADLRQLMLDI